ncbi:PDZ domain-containing protein [Chloracidobacterium sp. MS 40/45]|uniref:PDZ domain-containing protein n=1 Tax=Chloracidobacterium aggregatum TaxID=2851959 RepID=UPI001B8AB546|nr:PDZ domain-containing protein [Chloracidobacterium aggregatum]QUV99642.1 PDZ domain-containing protein [Chloracidobacterium sp. MS 40/45]
MMLSHSARALTMKVLAGALLSGAIGYAQVAERPRDAASASRKPDLRRSDTAGVGRWLVIVNHHVTMGELTAAAEDVSTAALDGTCAPSDVVLTNVTTGIVVDDKGHVLTQLVNVPPGPGNPTIVVQTQDRQEFQARFIGRDGATGLCVLQVPGLQVAPPTMHALAAPGRKLAVRDARASAKPLTVRIMLPMFQPPAAHATPGRAEESASRLVWDEVVTDWVVDPSLALPVEANCGVAVDSQNRLVAIVQPKGRQLRVLPVADVKRVMHRIISAGKSVPHGWLGIEGKTLATFPAEERARFGASATQGVVVTAVVPGSPAEEAGLAPGDLILTANDQPLESRRELNEVVVSHAAGETLTLLVERGGQQHVCEVTLGSPEDMPTPRVPDAEHLAIGLVTSDLTTQLAQFFGVAGGLLVTHVLADSPAAAAGLRSGDVIVRVDGQPVRRGRDLSAVMLQSLSQQGEAPVTVEIIRERQPQQLLLALPLPPPKL